jgi:transcriptional regulator with XRE-family HTH domain
MNASQFADAIGIKPANLSHVLSGRNKPSMDFLEKVIESFPKVNASWLLTGIVRAEEPESKEIKRTNQPSNVEATMENKVIERIVIFYKDGSFKEYASSLDNTTSD